MTEHLNYLRTEDSMLKSPDNCNLFTPAQSGWFYVEGDFPLTSFRSHSGDYVPMCCMANVTSWSSNMAPEHFLYMNLWWHYSQDRSWSEYWEFKDGGQLNFTHGTLTQLVLLLLEIKSKRTIALFHLQAKQLRILQTNQLQL